MMLTIGQCTIGDIIDAPEFAGLVEEYAQESAIPGLPKPQAKLEQ